MLQVCGVQSTRSNDARNKRKVGGGILSTSKESHKDTIEQQKHLSIQSSLHNTIADVKIPRHRLVNYRTGRNLPSCKNDVPEAPPDEQNNRDYKTQPLMIMEADGSSTNTKNPSSNPASTRKTLQSNSLNTFLINSAEDRNPSTTKQQKWCQKKQQNQTKQIFKTSLMSQQEMVLREKARHGQFQRTLEQQQVDKEASNLWLKSSSLKRATKATICAI